MVFTDLFAGGPSDSGNTALRCAAGLVSPSGAACDGGLRVASTAD